MATTLTDCYVTMYSFIHKKFVEIVCQVLEIEPERLNKA